jgi:glutamyl-tRNA reductase
MTTLTPISLVAPSPAEVATALRSKASAVIGSELDRLHTRVGLDDRTRSEVATTLDRIAGALFDTACTQLTDHTGSPMGERYASALQQLFALVPDSDSRRTR